MTAQYTNTAYGTVGPFNTGNADKEDLTTRSFVHVPHRYVDRVLGCLFLTRQVWDKLGATIINDGNQAQCAHLLTWIRISCTNSSPVNHMGTMTTALVPVIKTEFISCHRWDIITRDLLSLVGNSVPNNQFLQIVGAIQRDQATNCAANKAHRIANKQDKAPS